MLMGVKRFLVKEKGVVFGFDSGPLVAKSVNTCLASWDHVTGTL